MATAVYTLCALTSGVCAVLLAREYRKRGTRLLLWSSISFWGFTLANLLAFTDFVVLPDIQLAAIRAPLASLSVAALLFGLVWDSD